MSARVRQLVVTLGVAAAIVLVSAALHAAAKPMRILLLVDSSTSTSTMLNEFRAGLNAFIDVVPDDAEMTIVSTGGQLRVRVPVTADRAKLHAGAKNYSSDGGGNSLVETMMEADSRFLKKAEDKWPVIVILTTDNGDSRDEVRIDAYNKFMNDYLKRGGTAHAVVIKGKNIGVVTEITNNFVSNTKGVVEVGNLPTIVADKMKAIGERLSATYKSAQ